MELKITYNTSGVITEDSISHDKIFGISADEFTPIAMRFSKAITDLKTKEEKLTAIHEIISEITARENSFEWITMLIVNCFISMYEDIEREK